MNRFIQIGLKVLAWAFWAFVVGTAALYWFFFDLRPDSDFRHSGFPVWAVFQFGLIAGFCIFVRWWMIPHFPNEIIRFGCCLGGTYLGVFTASYGASSAPHIDRWLFTIGLLVAVQFLPTYMHKRRSQQNVGDNPIYAPGVER